MMSAMPKITDEKKMGLILIFVVLSLLPSFSFAGSWNGWVYQNPYPTSNTLLAVKFINTQKGWVAGTSGTLLYTQDGGINWRLQESGTQQDLRGIAFVNEQIGWVVGNGGTILSTKNGGQNWESQESAVGPLHKVFFLDEKEGWIGGDGGTLLYTKDGGKKWEKKNLGTFWPIAGIHFMNSKTGWVLEGGKIHRTTDGGAQWKTTLLPLPDLPPSGFMKRVIPREERTYSGRGGVFFFNEKKGWAAMQSNAVFYTEDGGATWERKDLAFWVSSIAFADGKNGCVGSSTILCTEDGGKTWRDRLGARSDDGTLIIDRYLINIQAISFPSPKEGWAVGGSGGQGINDGQIMKTEDGGKSWRMAGRNEDPAYFFDSNTGWRAQNNFRLEKGSIVQTADGGDTWTVQKAFGANINVNFFFTDPMTGWVVGLTRTSGEGGTRYLNYFIFHTEDGGKTWITQFDEPAGKEQKLSDGLLDVFFINRDVGWVVGSRGRILHTKDGGRHWEHQKSGTVVRLRGVQFVDDNKGWAVGESKTNHGSTAVFMHTENGGKEWNIQLKKEADWMGIRALQFIDNSTGWVAGAINEYSGDCILLRTTDGGTAWSEMEFEGIDFQQMKFIDKDRGAIITGKSHILITRDGGKAWKTEIMPLQRYPWHISEVFKEK